MPYVGEGGQTTGDVAEILESKYAVMEGFWELHGDEVARHMEAGLAKTLEAILQGAPPTVDPFAGAMSETQQMFRKFLDNEEMAGLAGGVPTQAALMGRSLRFKRKRGPRRPSFIDSGLYQDSFQAWVTGNAND